MNQFFDTLNSDNQETGEKEMTERVKPELLGGFRDYLPADMINRQMFIEKIQKIYERFGFVPLDTPAIERSSVLGTDIPDFGMEVYRFTAGDQDVTLRFDLTVPLARVIAAYPDLPKPFKRYQIGKVWRKEKPQAGRFREFVQFDVDIVGSKSMLADTEIIIIIYTTLTELGVDKFLIRFNSRKVLNALPEYVGFDPKRIKDVLRILDKLEKVGLDKVKEELKRQPENVYDEALAFSDESIKKIIVFLQISSGDNIEILKRLSGVFGGNETAKAGIKELREICDNLIVAGIPQKNWEIDLSVARGLDYYTGPVFETTLLELPSIGSVFSGGRFDGLIGKFANDSIPATGASIGVDRFYAALEQLGKLKTIPTTTKVLVTVFNELLGKKSLEFAQKLRNTGINTEVYLNEEKLLKEQMIYAVKQEIPFVVIIGPDEEKKGMVTLKDLQTRKQVLLTEEECLAMLKGS